VADLRPRDERGQILLIAAFTLAVIFVALALVVNSAIFTENLASQGEVAGSSEALTYQHQVRQSVTEAMAYANRYRYSNPTSSVQASVDALSEQGAHQQATGGQLVHVGYEGSRSGWRIADNTSGGSTFENESVPVSDQNWQLAESVDRTRDLEITITDESVLSGTKASAFTLEANESTSEIWELRLWSTGGEVVVDVETASGRSGECRVPTGSPVEIDVTRGLVDGQRCHALTRNGTGGDRMWWGTGVSSPYDIWIKNGDQIRGNYSMILRGGSHTGDGLVDGPDSGDDPFRTDAMYSATVEYLFRTSQVTYETEIEVAPGETP